MFYRWRPLARAVKAASAALVRTGNLNEGPMPRQEGTLRQGAGGRGGRKNGANGGRFWRPACRLVR